MTSNRRWFRSLRFRITAIATVVFAAVLVAVGLFAFRNQQARLVETIDDSLRETIMDVETALDLSTRPGSPAQRRRVPRLEEELSQRLSIAVSQRPLQLISADGEVLTSSAALSGLGPLVDLEDTERGFRTVDSPFGDGGRYRVAVFDVTEPGGDMLVAAKSMADVDQAADSLRAALLVGTPILIAVMAGLIWMVTGRALAPVERIRREVDDITASGLDRRVSVPTTSLELEALSTTMNEMLGRLDSSAKRQQRFVADASHELRSPLAAMRSQLEVNLAHPEDADWEEAGMEVLEETVRMQHLVDDLLALARAETAHPPRGHLVDLDDTVLREVARLRRVADVAVDLSRVSAAQVRAAEGELERVVRNLAENAARHAATTISFRVEEAGGGVELEVSDDGPGIPAEEAEAVFERFSRLEESRDRDSGGSGLGLAIVRELVERNGGTITLVATRPAGATFVVRFPGAVAEAPDGPRERRPGRD